MPAPAHVVIAFAKAEPDQKAASSLALGFRRDGTLVDQVTELGEVLELLDGAVDERPDLVVASLNLEGRGDGIELVRAVRAAHDPGVRVESARPPVIVVGDGERRGAALEAGASAFVAKPAYVKDIVTLAGILSMTREGLEPGWGGELGGLHLYYVVRALGAARRTGVLTLIRGGRRGELRFYDGEVTSAQVGTMHGQAAFHQLLLWPEAHFDLRAEQVVRRQQIPLSPLELLQDAERFLRDFTELASGIAPSSLYEHDPKRAAECVDQIPREVTPVMRLFDGTRSVADVIEDSPTRLAETLKIVKKLITLGTIRKLGAPRPHADTAPALLVEDWLVGGGPSDGRPVPIEPGGDGKPPPEPVPVGDWGMGMSHAVWEAASYAPVVPSLSATGEISVGAAAATAAPSSDTSKKSGTGNGETADSSHVRTNGKTAGAAMAAPKSERAETKRINKNKNLKSVPVAAVAPRPEQPEAPREKDTVRDARPAGQRSKSGEISVQTAAVERSRPAAAVEVAADVPSVTSVTPPPELVATAPVRVVVPGPSIAPPTPKPPPAKSAATAHERFEDHEEEFFRQEEAFALADAPAGESFEDLDEGQPQLGFWKRLFRKLR